jgi:hypothetical protein
MSDDRDRFHDPFRRSPEPDQDDEESAEAGWGPRGRRKERILHTRVSRQLSEEIRRVAGDLRVPVSNLVRNVLEEAFHVVEQVSGDVGEIVEEVIEEAERARDRFRRRAWRHRGHWHEAYDAAQSARGGSRNAARAEARDEPDRSGREPQRPAEAAAAPGGMRQDETPSAQEVRGARMVFPGVVGWQPLVLDVARRCACDDRPLERGDDAWVGLTEQGLSGYFLCGPCMTARRA